MRSTAAAIAALLIVLGTAASGIAGTATQNAKATHRVVHHHRHRQAKSAHVRIGPGGDRDSDNHGAPSDGDGDL
jgi:hypothetical protein